MDKNLEKALGLVRQYQAQTTQVRDALRAEQAAALIENAGEDGGIAARLHPHLRKHATTKKGARR